MELAQAKQALSHGVEDVLGVFTGSLFWLCHGGGHLGSVWLGENTPGGQGEEQPSWSWFFSCL